VTESEWLTSTRLKSLTDYLLREKVVSQRKLRLYAVACCRCVEHLLEPVELRKALDAAERFAEGKIKSATLTSWLRKVWAALGDDSPLGTTAASSAAGAIPILCQTSSAYLHAPLEAATALAFVADPKKGSPAWQAAYEQARQMVFALLRDVVGNPFRPVPTVEAAWRTPTVERLAVGIYDERRFDELPILGDALEDAGCAEAALLEHLREPGPHDRGCWALDLILGKS
jgi:hypothetical protein